MPIGATRAEQLAQIRLIDSLTRGVDTLEWCDANDPDNAPDPTEVEMLDQIETILIRDQSDESAIT